jgi:hypothetical protein
MKDQAPITIISVRRPSAAFFITWSPRFVFANFDSGKGLLLTKIVSRVRTDECRAYYIADVVVPSNVIFNITVGLRKGFPIVNNAGDK